jgi:hypothetical protein
VETTYAAVARAAGNHERDDAGRVAAGICGG